MLKSLFKHLRVRRVLSTIAIYVIGTWLVLQVTETVFPGLGVPDWAIRFVIIAALAGLPLAVVFAWMFRSRRRASSEVLQAAAMTLRCETRTTRSSVRFSSWWP